MLAPQLFREPSWRCGISEDCRERDPEHEETSPGEIDLEQHEVSHRVQSDTVPEPRTVMAVSEDAFPAAPAMPGPLRSRYLTLGAEEIRRAEILLWDPLHEVREREVCSRSRISSSSSSGRGTDLYRPGRGVSDLSLLLLLLQWLLLVMLLSWEITAALNHEAWTPEDTRDVVIIDVQEEPDPQEGRRTEVLDPGVGADVEEVSPDDPGHDAPEEEDEER